MTILRFFNKHFTYRQQKGWINSMAFGILFSAIGLSIYWAIHNNQHIFRLLIHFISTIIVDAVFFSLVLLPIIINVWRSNRKLKRLKEKISKDDGNVVKIVAIFDFKESIKKGEVYEVKGEGLTTMYIHEKDTIVIINDIINKFDIDSLRESRLRKLKKLNI